MKARSSHIRFLDGVFAAMLALVASAGIAPAKPLKVYILAGQSNMQGHAEERVIAGLKSDPTTKALYDKIMSAEDEFRVFEDVQIAALSGKLEEPAIKSGPLTIGFGGNLGGQPGAQGKNARKFGPELGFGVTMREQLQEPFLIIKTAWGGKSLRKDFLPPSGVKVAGGDAVTGAYYQAMCAHVHAVLADPAKHHPAYDPKQGYEIAGFVWFQGWNDMMGKEDPLYVATEDKPAFAAYSELLACFIRDVRGEFKAPEMPFVIGVIGTGGNPDEKNPFREAMAAPAVMPEFKGTVTAVHTAKYFDDKLNELVDRSWRWERPNWDPDNKYADLRAKLAPLQQKLKEGQKLPTQAERAKVHWGVKKEMNDIMYNAQEQQYLAENHSNAGYHYLGSGKILGRIGEAFAEAMIAMQKQK